MQFQQDGDYYFINLDMNERLIETLTQFCVDHKIVNGQISAIGALKEVELGAYILEKKDYVREMFQSLHELVSTQGNITLKEGKPLVHLHVCIGDHHFNTKAGHLFEAKVGIVCEIILTKINTTVHRELNPTIGLALCHC